MIARPLAAAHIPVDASLPKARRRRRTEQKVIDPEARIAAPGIPEIIPEGVDRLVGVEVADGIGPALGKQAAIRLAALRLEEGVLQP